MRALLFLILISNNIFASEILDKSYAEKIMDDMKFMITLKEKKVDYGILCYERGIRNKSNFLNDNYCVWLRENGESISKGYLTIGILYREMINSNLTRDAINFINSNYMINKSIDGKITKISIAEYYYLISEQDKDIQKKLLKAGFFD